MSSPVLEIIPSPSLRREYPSFDIPPPSPMGQSVLKPSSPDALSHQATSAPFPMSPSPIVPNALQRHRRQINKPPIYLPHCLPSLWPRNPMEKRARRRRKVQMRQVNAIRMSNAGIKLAMRLIEGNHADGAELQGMEKMVPVDGLELGEVPKYTNGKELGGMEVSMSLNYTAMSETSFEDWSDKLDGQGKKAAESRKRKRFDVAMRGDNPVLDDNPKQHRAVQVPFVSTQLEPTPWESDDEAVSPMDNHTPSAHHPSGSSMQISQGWKSESIKNEYDVAEYSEDGITLDDHTNELEFDLIGKRGHARDDGYLLVWNGRNSLSTEVDAGRHKRSTCSELERGRSKRREKGMEHGKVRERSRLVATRLYGGSGKAVAMAVPDGWQLDGSDFEFNVGDMGGEADKCGVNYLVDTLMDPQLLNTQLREENWNIVWRRPANLGHITSSNNGKGRLAAPVKIYSEDSVTWEEEILGKEEDGQNETYASEAEDLHLGETKRGSRLIAAPATGKKGPNRDIHYVVPSMAQRSESDSDDAAEIPEPGPERYSPVHIEEDWGKWVEGRRGPYGEDRL
ncbi:hypothetical protein BDZ91DRAFT_768852 [Kalaharituber pfeilii]|nr:hypothetical protein BDZ91DRAFT_768852 [Kalaharituber pfeilii]